MKMKALYLFFCPVLLLLNSPFCHSKHISGILQTDANQNWHFLTRFCFLPDKGSLKFKIQYPVSYLTQSMLLYWDKPKLWNSVYKTGLSCKEKEAKLDILSYQIFRLSTDSGLCKSVDNGTAVLCDSAEYQFKSARERWWFIVISNCASRSGLLLKYDMWLRNGDPGDLFREHFSADEIYILEFNIGFFFLQSALLVLAVLIAHRLRKKQLLHTTYKIFLLSAFLQLLSITLTCIAYISYGSTGVKSNVLKYMAAALHSTASIAFVMMLLLLSLGYTITCGRLPTWATALISVFMTAFAVGYVALFAVEAATFDPALVLYRWESQPGYGLIALMLAAWLFYIAGCCYSFVRHRRKRSFYVPMAAFFSLWLLSTPIAVAVNITRVPDYMREKVVNFVELGILFAAQLFYLVITRPTVSNTNFPFHIKTSQIGVITFEEAAIRSSDDAADGESSPYDRRRGGNGPAAAYGGYKYPAAAAAGQTAYDLPDGTAFSDFSIFTVLAEPAGSRQHQPPPQRPPPPTLPAVRQQSAGSPSCESRLLSGLPQQQQQQQFAVGGSSAFCPVYEEIQDGCSTRDRPAYY